MKANLKKGEKVAGIATIVTLFLSAGKAIAGFFSGSVALMADAIHSGADVVAIFASWFGLKISQRKATEKFPYGYYKAENLATLVVSAFIFYAAYEIFIESYQKLFTIGELNIPFVALGVSLASSVISLFIAHYEKKVGEEINSQSLIANSQESRMDVIASFIVFAGILFSYFGISYVEAGIGILLSLLIFKIAFENGKISVYSLMDASLDKELNDKVKKQIMKIKGVRKLNSLRLRQSGPFQFGEASLEVSKALDVKRAHEIADNIEDSIKKIFPQIESFSVHIEPYQKTDVKILIPITSDKGLDSEPMGHFGRADKFLFVRISNKRIKTHYVKQNPYKDKDVRAGLAAAKDVLDENIDAIVLEKIGEISFHTLRDGLVDIYHLKGSTAKEVLDNFIGGRLEILEKPTHDSDK